MGFKIKKDKMQNTYALTSKEMELDNAIFQITDKGTREEKERLLKILKNRTKIVESLLK
jgi:hypothetical protein